MALATFVAHEIAHVLDYPEDGHIDLLEHRDALAGVDQGEVLGRRYDDGAGKVGVLRHRQLCVAGAGRHVDDQHIERPPCNVTQHLRDCAHHHWAAPDEGFRFVDDEADRHDFDTVAVEGHECALADYGGFGAKAEKLRHRRAVNVGVQDADLQA